MADNQQTMASFPFLSPVQSASPARKGRKGKAVPAEVETAVVAEKKKEEVVLAEKEEVVKEKEEEEKVEKKKVGRKAKSAPAIVETIKEVEVTTPRVNVDAKSDANAHALFDDTEG